MRVATMVSLGASAALGLGALLVVKLWTPAHPAHAEATVRAQPGVPVVVASRALAYGAPLDAGALTLVRLPAGAAPQGAYSSIAQVIAQAGGSPVTLAPIAAHEALLPAKISGPGARATLSAGIEPGMRAYTIRVSDVAGVGGHALPGDRVDVVMTRDLSTDKETKRPTAFVLIQDARVLGVDLNIDPASTKSQEPRTATLEVSAEDAVRLALAPETGTLSLALRRSGSVETTRIAAVSAASLAPDRLAASDVGAGPRHARSAPARPARARVGGGFGAGVLVINGSVPAAAKGPSGAVAAGA